MAAWMDPVFSSWLPLVLNASQSTLVSRGFSPVADELGGADIARQTGMVKRKVTTIRVVGTGGGTRLSRHRPGLASKTIWSQAFAGY